MFLCKTTQVTVCKAAPNPRQARFSDGMNRPPLDSEFQTLLQTYMVILAASSVNLNIGKLQLKVEQYLVEPKVLSKNRTKKFILIDKMN
jgi:hypothetical protein